MNTGVVVNTLTAREEYNATVICFGISGDNGIDPKIKVFISIKNYYFYAPFRPSNTPATQNFLKRSQSRFMKRILYCILPGLMAFLPIHHNESPRPLLHPEFAQ